MKSRLTIFLLTSLMTLAGHASSATSELQDLDWLQQEAKKQITSIVAKNPNIRYEIKVRQPGAKLKLSACNDNLSFFTHERNPASAARINLGVKCHAENPWSLYLPAEIFRYGKVAVGTRAFRRGDEIQDADIHWVEKRLEDLPRGYFLTRDELQQQRVIRNIRRGSVLSPASVKPAFIVKKGERVTIQAQLGGIRIKMAGKAITNGSLGQTIRVKNLSSERIVQAIVSEPGIVDVRL